MSLGKHVFYSTLATCIFLFIMAAIAAYAQRGYFALGGEILIFAIPVLVFAYVYSGGEW